MKVENTNHGVSFSWYRSGGSSLQRNVSSLAIRFLQEKGVQWLFDCGEATQHQMMKSAISPSKIDRVFITHLHGDHIYGLPGFLGTRSFQGATSPLTVYGPAGLESFIKTALTVSGTYLRYDLEIIEIFDGQTIDAGFATVSVCELKHTIESYGFRIKEKDKPGELDVGRRKRYRFHQVLSIKRLNLAKRLCLKMVARLMGLNLLDLHVKVASLLLQGTRNQRMLW